jgi:tetratricopeptide (TPR) repeat protein
MVMPFRKRPVPSPPEGAPGEVDFDALWFDAIKPALEQLGFVAVRADCEMGSVIIKDMLERLAFADLVLADLTLPNGNVYYEVGIRHVAKQSHCVLIAASWSRQLFDVDQMRSIRYPLPDGSVPAEVAAAIREQLVQQLNAVKNARTPFHELVTDKHDSTIFRDQIELLSAFQAEVHAIHLLPDREERIQQVKALIERSKQSLELRDVVFELLMLVRDNLSWQAMIDYIDSLPPAIRDDDFVREQRLLAQSKLGDHARAIAGLKELIQLRGQSPERLGLLGGRYKKLWLQAHRERLERGDALPSLQEEAYLEDAIEHYRQGANLDLNEYYCVCNLPALLRVRGGPGDEEDAGFFDRLTKVASQRKIDRREDDGWARAALLGAAFRQGDVAEVARLARDVVREGPATWQLESTLTDIHEIVSNLPPSSSREQLSQICDQLAAMITPPAR